MHSKAQVAFSRTRLGPTRQPEAQNRAFYLLLHNPEARLGASRHGLAVASSLTNRDMLIERIPKNVC